MIDQPTESLIAEIRCVYDDLRELKVYPKRENLRKMSDEQLREELSAVSDQLKTRKKFLGVE